jgi:hypothetical protein
VEPRLLAGMGKDGPKGVSENGLRNAVRLVGGVRP